MLDVDIRPVGDAAVLAVVGEAVDESVSASVWSLEARLRAAVGNVKTGILDVVPAYASVFVRFDPTVTDVPRVMAWVRGEATRASGGTHAPRRLVTLRVCFGGACGVDFERSAHDLGMRESRLRDALCAPTYRVAFLGYVAGFPYLTGLPPALRLPRLSGPRPRVPAGSVAIAAGQCGIYPRTTPGAWRLMGRTLAPLFDPARERPALLAPGDAVRFVAVASLGASADADVAPTAGGG